jgi:hypothetical protein
MPAYPRELPTSWYFVGLDLGQAQDFSALAIDEITPHGGIPHHAIRHLERFELGTLPPTIVSRIKVLFEREPLMNGCLAVDGTGVGRAVVDLLRQADMRAGVNPITITSGREIHQDAEGYWHVAKRELVGTTLALMQSGRLTWAKAMPLADVLATELTNFRVKITASANETFEAWREGQHDDLCLAVFLAVWLAERAMPELLHPEYSETILSYMGA